MVGVIPPFYLLNMKKRNKIYNLEHYLPFVMILFVLSCTGNKVNDKRKMSVVAGKMDVFIRNVKFPVIYELQGERIPLDVLKPTTLIAIDSFLVVGEDDSEHQMSIFDRRTLKHLVSLFPKGNGPDDIVLMAPLYYWRKINNNLEVWVNSLHKYYGGLNINKTVQEKKAVFNTKYEFNQHKRGENILYVANHMFTLADSSLFIAIDINRSKSVKENINSSISHYDYKSKSVISSFYFTDYKWEKIDYPTMVCDMDMRADEKKIAVGYKYFNQIIILDIETGRRTYLTTDADFSTVTKAIQDKCLFYRYIEVTDDLIFALNYSQGDKGCYFDVFDWDGKAVCQLQLPGQFYNPFIDPNTNTLYMFNGEYEIWSFKLDVITQQAECLRVF